MHTDQAIGVPAGAELLGASARCANHGFLLPGRALTVQGHPEFDADVVQILLDFRHAAGIFSDAEYADAIPRVNIPHDGVAVARAFVRFLRGDL